MGDGVMTARGIVPTDCHQAEPSHTGRPYPLTSKGPNRHGSGPSWLAGGGPPGDSGKATTGWGSVGDEVGGGAPVTDQTRR